MKEICILGIFVSDRVLEAGAVQQVLTKYGCNIKTRIGLHDVDENYCSVNGVIILELCGKPEDQKKLESEIRAISGITIQKMNFTK